MSAEPINLRCTDCNGLIGIDFGPIDGWQMEDGRTICHKCCSKDLSQLSFLVSKLSNSDPGGCVLPEPGGFYRLAAEREARIEAGEPVGRERGATEQQMPDFVRVEDMPGTYLYGDDVRLDNGQTIPREVVERVGCVGLRLSMAVGEPNPHYKEPVFGGISMGLYGDNKPQ